MTDRAKMTSYFDTLFGESSCPSNDVFVFVCKRRHIGLPDKSGKPRFASMIEEHEGESQHKMLISQFQTVNLTVELTDKLSKNMK